MAQPLPIKPTNDFKIPKNWQLPHLAINYTSLPPLPALDDPAIRTRVLTYVHSSTTPDWQHYAFLGDSVLGTAAAQALMSGCCGGMKVNHMARLRAALVTNNIFSYLALAYHLTDHISLESHTQKAAADIFEAYIGAIYKLEKDDFMEIRRVEHFLEALYHPHIWPAVHAWEKGDVGVLERMLDVADLARAEDKEAMWSPEERMRRKKDGKIQSERLKVLMRTKRSRRKGVVVVVPRKKKVGVKAVVNGGS